MANNVAVVGIGQTKHDTTRNELSMVGLVREAALVQQQTDLPGELDLSRVRGQYPESRLQPQLWSCVLSHHFKFEGSHVGVHGMQLPGPLQIGAGLDCVQAFKGESGQLHIDHRLRFCRSALVEARIEPGRT